MLRRSFRFRFLGYQFAQYKPYGSFSYRHVAYGRTGVPRNVTFIGESLVAILPNRVTVNAILSIREQSYRPVSEGYVIACVMYKKISFYLFIKKETYYTVQFEVQHHGEYNIGTFDWRLLRTARLFVDRRSRFDQQASRELGRPNSRNWQLHCPAAIDGQDAR